MASRQGPEAASPDAHPGEAFERSLEALAHKERTTVELERWLRERGFPAPAVADAIERLLAIGELDDERYARRYAEDKRELRGWGADRIREALLDRGIDRATAEAAVGAGADEELERAVELLRRRAAPLDSEVARARALAYLARRGYDSDTAYEAVRAAERQAA